MLDYVLEELRVYEGLSGVKSVAWNVQKINRVSWIIFVQITVLFVAFPKLWTIISRKF